MADCPLADECPRYTERIQGMGCSHYGDRGGAEWCASYDMPISDLKSQPVTPGEEVTLDVDDIHESGAGVAKTDDGFIVLVDGVLPPARVTVRIDQVKQNHARAKTVVTEHDPDGEDETTDTAEPSTDEDDETERRGLDDDRLGSRENFWGG
ncbi:MAG: putative RNA-binding protein, contains TRAM domain protein [halophilic archaeon J07HB67]|jgi:Predicted RNA-binding protein, contains TRAM domain|nr:MAG: putative RNA-binding protein, contains TRAM domain protein [halophilic archaeon J07HB67]